MGKGRESLGSEAMETESPPAIPRCDILNVPALIVEAVTITVSRGGVTLFERTVNASLAGQDRIVHYLTLGVSKPSRRNKRVRKNEKGEA